MQCKSLSVVSLKIDIEKRWKQYFETLLNVSYNVSGETKNLRTDSCLVLHHLENDVGRSTSLDGIEKAISCMKNKYPGCNGLWAIVRDFRMWWWRSSILDTTCFQCSIAASCRHRCRRQISLASFVNGINRRWRKNWRSVNAKKIFGWSG